MMTTILQALYLMLPAYLANMAPVFVKKIPYGATPLDHGKKWRGKRIFGDHKTYRGVIAGICAAIIVVMIQTFLNAKKISLLPYENFSAGKIILVGFLFGMGTLGGDIIKSFFKRRLGIREGAPWIPFDQLDFVIGALIALSVLYTPPLFHLLLIIFITPLLHFLVNLVGYWLGLKEVWW